MSEQDCGCSAWERAPFALLHACTECDCRWATLEGILQHPCEHECGELAKDRFIRADYLPEPTAPATIAVWELMGGRPREHRH